MSVNSISGGELALQTASFSKTSQVLQRIEGQVGKLQDIAALIQGIVAELESLSPPSYPGENASDSAKKAYEKDKANFEEKVNRLNTLLSKAYEDLAKANEVLDSMNTTDMPAAEREDFQQAQKAIKEAEERVESTLKNVEEGDQDLTSGDAEKLIRVSIRKLNGKNLLAVQRGDKESQRSAEADKLLNMPKTPATTP